MKQSYKNRDIFILLISLIIFSYGISFLHGKNDTLPEPPTMISNNANENDPQLAVSSSDIMGIISSFIIAHDVVKVSDIIARFLSISQQKELVEKLIKNRYNDLTIPEKARLIVLMALKQKTDSDRNLFFDLFNKHLLLFREYPIIYLAAEQPYTSEGIPFLLQWFNLQPTLKKKAISWALRAAIMKNQPAMVQQLLTQGIILSADQATDLLWYAISQKSSPTFVEIFKKAGANMADSRKGQTFLTAATELNQLPLVQALLQNGVLVNDIKDPAVGSALQIAARKGYTDIELLLRKNGARLD